MTTTPHPEQAKRVEGPSIATALKAARTAAGLSQRALAQAAGVGQSTISNLESGASADPELPIARKLAEALDIDVGALLGLGTETANPAPHPEQGHPEGVRVEGRDNTTSTLPLDELVLWRGNPRKRVNNAGLADLCNSILEVGLLQPLLVIPPRGWPDVTPGKLHRWQVVDGQRRLAALDHLAADVAIARDHPVPVRILDLDTEASALPDALPDALLAALTSNLSREDMTHHDEAVALADLYAAGVTVAALANAVGRTDRHVQKRIQLARDLPDAARDHWAAGRMTTAQAEVILDGDDDAMKRDLLTMALNGYARTETAMREALEKLRATRRAQAEAEAQIDAFPAAATAETPAPHPEQGPQGAASKPHPEQGAEGPASKDLPPPPVRRGEADAPVTWRIAIGTGGATVAARGITDKELDRFLRACHLPGDVARLDRITITRRDA